MVSLDEGLRRLREFILMLLLGAWDVLRLRDPFKQRSIRWLEERLGQLNRRVDALGLRDDLKADTLVSLAYLYYEQGDISQVQASFNRARVLYLTAQRNAARLRDEPSSHTKLGILLSAPLYEDHDLKAAFELFGEAIFFNECKHGAYWRGRALLNGFGTDRDTKRGFELIQQAAATGVLRAKLELAGLLEEGCEGEAGPCIRKNPVLAEEYYRSISITPLNNPRVIPATEAERLFLQDLVDQERVRDYALSYLSRNDDFLDKEDTMGLQVGSLLSWEFAGQAFLFGAAAALGNTIYYKSLPMLLPYIGIAIGILSCFSSTSVYLKNGLRRRDLVKLFKAKAKACNRLVPPQLRPWNHYFGVFRVRLQSSLAALSDICAVGLSLLFIAAWSKIQMG
jgi:hypothetical protein